MDQKYEPLISETLSNFYQKNNEGIRTIEVEGIRSPDARSRGEDITSFVNTTPRMKGPTVTSFQHTSLEDEASYRFRKILQDNRSKSE